MSEYGVVTEPGTVRFERLLPGSVDLVWAYLTDPEKRERIGEDRITLFQRYARGEL